MAFYALLVWAYLRRAPSSRYLRWTSWVVALLGTAAPFAIPLVSSGVRDSGVEASPVLELWVGLVAMLWTLGALVRMLVSSRRLVRLLHTVRTRSCVIRFTRPS